MIWIRPIRLSSGFGDHRFITAHDDGIIWAEDVTPKKTPCGLPPIDRRVEKPLNGALASTFAGPASHPSHGHSPRHGEHRDDDDAQTA